MLYQLSYLGMAILEVPLARPLPPAGESQEPNEKAARILGPLLLRLWRREEFAGRQLKAGQSRVHKYVAFVK